jgi:hypothetical protein
LQLSGIALAGDSDRARLQKNKGETMKRFYSPKSAASLAALFFLLVIAPFEVMAEKIPFSTTHTYGNGCSVKLSGYYDTNTGQAHGQATFSGSIPCRVGTNTFFVTPNSDPTRGNRERLSVRFDTDNMKEVRSATWSGRDKDAVERLSNKELNEKFLEAIRRAAAKGDLKRR